MINKKITHNGIRVLAATMVLTMLPVVSGCKQMAASADEHPVATAYIIGNHANSKRFDFNNKNIIKSVRDTIVNNGFISVVNCDGEPEILFSRSFEVSEEFAGADPSKIKADQYAAAAALLREMANTTADDPEVDTLKAIRLAVRSFDGLPADTVKEIVIFDTGLPTCGVLDFRRNILYADVNTVVDKLAARNEIPDLEGIKVTWIQMGDTASPQKDLSEKQKAKLRELWEKIIMKGLGEFNYSNVPYGADTQKVYPNVSIVDLPDELPIEFEPDEMQSESDTVFQDPKVLNEAKVGFVPDSDEFLNLKTTKTVIQPIADYLLSHDEVRLVLAGTAAGDENTAFAVDLSYRRAVAVKNILVSMGVDESRLTAKGLGVTDPWHIIGVGTSGELAVQNRKVVLIDREKAKELGIE